MKMRQRQAMYHSGARRGYRGARADKRALVRGKPGTAANKYQPSQGNALQSLTRSPTH